MSAGLNWALVRWGTGLGGDRHCNAKRSTPCWRSAGALEGRAPATLSLAHFWDTCVDMLRWSMPSSYGDIKSFDWCLYQFGVNPPTAHLSAVAWHLCYRLSHHTLGLFGMEVGGNHGRGDYKSQGWKAAASSNTQQTLLWLCNMVPQRGRRSTSFSLWRMFVSSPAAISCC